MYVEPKKNHTLSKNKNIYSLIVYIHNHNVVQSAL